MKKEYVKVSCLCTEDGSMLPQKIIWADGREWPIKRIMHACTSSYNEYEGIRYTVLIGSAVKYLYKLGSKWYVDSG